MTSLLLASLGAEGRSVATGATTAVSTDLILPLSQIETHQIAGRRPEAARIFASALASYDDPSSWGWARGSNDYSYLDNATLALLLLTARQSDPALAERVATRVRRTLEFARSINDDDSSPDVWVALYQLEKGLGREDSAQETLARGLASLARIERGTSHQAAVEGFRRGGDRNSRET